eukprot:gnl/TRDRNA2_/TRDRNA2_128566_c0_seq1.p1 gnl/TRDRNA2_/TRDRNA2_128566_c0~~gnl/TRDRNA2_/TRDRNA2_128566_c0_seq1.p1  ORF type:complete len:312 (+),score=54.05 gnl/TRDRNA2_/TRDRNA2_128566_c0_seq1:29-964(+)
MVFRAETPPMPPMSRRSRGVAGGGRTYNTYNEIPGSPAESTTSWSSMEMDKGPAWLPGRELHSAHLMRLCRALAGGGARRLVETALHRRCMLDQRRSLEQGAQRAEDASSVLPQASEGDTKQPEPDVGKAVQEDEEVDTTVSQEALRQDASRAATANEDAKWMTEVLRRQSSAAVHVRARLVPSREVRSREEATSTAIVEVSHGVRIAHGGNVRSCWAQPETSSSAQDQLTARKAAEHLKHSDNHFQPKANELIRQSKQPVAAKGSMRLSQLAGRNFPRLEVGRSQHRAPPPEARRSQSQKQLNSTGGSRK